ncbi:MAG: DUF3618 domain-containing protein [Actinomycetales bacterium]|nr:DUF3618 domain-containing protein [Actinomycetales bacterium]
MTSVNPSSVSGLTQEGLTAHLKRTRAELAATLDAVEEKVNVPKRLDKAAARMKAKLRTMRQENPVALAAIGAGAIGVVGLIAYAGYRSITRR